MSHRAPYLQRRRSFLKLLGGAGAAGAAASLFPWLRASAADEPPKRLILFFTPHGTIWDQWRPTGGETDFGLSYILAPLASHRDDLVIVDGLEVPAPYSHRVPHTYDMPMLWTGSPIDTTSSEFERMDHGVTFGWNTGVSIDQTVASRLAPMTPHPTIELGVRAGGMHPSARMIYTGPSMPKSPLDRPSDAWMHLFSGFGDPDAEAAARRRTSVLDTVLEDLNDVSRTQSGRDRERLDAHATSLRELEMSIASGAGTCTPPEAPTNLGLEFDIDAQSDLIVAALACGQTNIASMQVRVADNDNSLYPWLGLTTGGHHTASHDSSPAASATRTEVYRWYAGRFNHLLNQLAAIPEGDGTSLLDNTMVIWGSEIGIGWTHDISNVPFVVAGGGARGVRTGRYLRPSGMFHNRLLVSAAQYMGVSDITSYGSTDTGSGPLPGLLAL